MEIIAHILMKHKCTIIVSKASLTLIEKIFGDTYFGRALKIGSTL